jgi:hypothetical protein
MTYAWPGQKVRHCNGGPVFTVQTRPDCWGYVWVEVPPVQVNGVFVDRDVLKFPLTFLRPVHLA